MKTFIFLLLFLIATPVKAADLTCTLPNSAITRGTELCELLRQSLRVRLADWSNDLCASEMLRMGLIEAERDVSTQVARATVRTIVNDAVTTYEADHPHIAVPATCGDGVIDNVDPNLGEQCDDGNTTPGDGCDAVCQTE